MKTKNGSKRGGYTYYDGEWLKNQTYNRRMRILAKHKSAAINKPLAANRNVYDSKDPGFCWNGKNRMKTKKRVKAIAF